MLKVFYVMCAREVSGQTIYKPVIKTAGILHVANSLAGEPRMVAMQTEAWAHISECEILDSFILTLLMIKTSCL